MRNKLITISILLGTVLLLIGWDIYVYFAGENTDMITTVIWSTSKEHPIVPFMVGIVMGHLFWGRGSKD